jgi:predicted metal-dependent enzyme (double-stranded beta helix superfamily)
MTPVHDHLAWGLVGLYRGNQDEEFYRPADGALELVRRRPLEPGDFYALLPPRDDVHRVRTTSPETSVSIHLLANDTGCVWRHTFDEQTGEARPFRSGYVNADCFTDG